MSGAQKLLESYLNEFSLRTAFENLARIGTMVLLPFNILESIGEPKKIDACLLLTTTIIIRNE